MQSPRSSDITGGGRYFVHYSRNLRTPRFNCRCGTKYVHYLCTLRVLSSSLAMRDWQLLNWTFFILCAHIRVGLSRPFYFSTFAFGPVQHVLSRRALQQPSRLPCNTKQAQIAYRVSPSCKAGLIWPLSSPSELVRASFLVALVSHSLIHDIL